LLQTVKATVAVWNVIANLFVKAHADSKLATEILASATLFVDMIIVPPSEFLR